MARTVLSLIVPYNVTCHTYQLYSLCSVVQKTYLTCIRPVHTGRHLTWDFLHGTFCRFLTIFGCDIFQALGHFTHDWDFWSQCFGRKKVQMVKKSQDQCGCFCDFFARLLNDQKSHAKCRMSNVYQCGQALRLISDQNQEKLPKLIFHKFDFETKKNYQLLFSEAAKLMTGQTR